MIVVCKSANLQLKICITMQFSEGKCLLVELSFQNINRKYVNLVRRQVHLWIGKITMYIEINWLRYMFHLLRYSVYMILSDKDIESYVWIIMVIHIIHDLIIEWIFTVLLKYSWVLMSNLSYFFFQNICQTVII